ncbi:hypothetical protein MRX96_049023 [Rhipicephalus microplus]
MSARPSEGFKFDLSDTTPWDRAVEFGEGPFKCGSDVLGKSRVLRLALEGLHHWEPLCNLIQHTRSSAQGLLRGRPGAARS